MWLGLSCGQSPRECPFQRRSGTLLHVRGFFHRFDHQTRVDHLFARYRFGGLQQLKLVCGCNGHLCSPRSTSLRPSVSSSKSIFVNRARIFTLAQHFVDQLIRQNQLGVRQPIKFQTDGALINVDQHFIALNTGQLTFETAATVDQLIVSILAS